MGFIISLRLGKVAFCPDERIARHTLGKIAVAKILQRKRLQPDRGCIFGVGQSKLLPKQVIGRVEHIAVVRVDDGIQCLGRADDRRLVGNGKIEIGLG